MSLRQLIATLLTAVIFVNELGGYNAHLLDQLITMHKRPLNMNQSDNNNLSDTLTQNRVNSSISTWTSTTTTTSKISKVNQVEMQKRRHLCIVTSTVSSLLSVPESSSKPAKIEAEFVPDINTTSTKPRILTTTTTTTTTATAEMINLEAAALIKEDQFTLNALESENLIPLTTKTIEGFNLTTTTATTTPIIITATSDTVAQVETAILSPSVMSNSTNMTIALLAYNGNEYSEELFDSLPKNPLNKLDNIDGDLPPFDAEQQGVADLLTKGFSIPTFLPPFPVFAVADLPAYLNSVLTTPTTTTTTSTSSPLSQNRNEINSLQLSSNEQSLADLYGSYEKVLMFNQSTSRRIFYGTTTNITVQMGSHAYMPCHIKHLQNKPVSWVRVRDGHIISVDQTTFIADQRFQAIYQDDSEYTWSLQIKYVQPNDEGWYECQVSVEPKMSAKTYLKVVVPLTELIGDQSRFVKAGSKVALHCIVRGTLEPPQYIIWFRDKVQISDDNRHGWYTQLDRHIFGNNNSDNQNTIGSLIIPYVRKADSGNYTCQPSNSAAVSLDLHVLSGEYSASAIMSAANSCWLTVNHILSRNFIMVVIMLWISLYET